MTSANFEIVFWRGNVGTGNGTGNSHSFSLFVSGQKNREEKEDECQVFQLEFVLLNLFIQLQNLSNWCNFKFVAFAQIHRVIWIRFAYHGYAESGTGNANFPLFFSGQENWQEKEDECQVLQLESLLERVLCFPY